MFRKVNKAKKKKRILKTCIIVLRKANQILWVRPPLLSFFFFLVKSDILNLCLKFDNSCIIFLLSRITGKQNPSFLSPNDNLALSLSLFFSLLRMCKAINICFDWKLSFQFPKKKTEEIESVYVKTSHQTTKKHTQTHTPCCSLKTQQPDNLSSSSSSWHCPPFCFLVIWGLLFHPLLQCGLAFGEAAHYFLGIVFSGKAF